MAITIALHIALPCYVFEKSKFTCFDEATKRWLVLDALKRTAGNYTEAAQLLGIHPNNLHRLIRNLDLKLPPKK